MLVHSHASPQRPTRVVVIGSKGFVGSAICARLRVADIATVEIARGDVDLLQSDAAQRLATFLRPGDSVVAVAAMAPCRNIDMLVANMILAKAMIDATSDGDLAHVVNISSDAVYGDEIVPITETAPAAPTTLHGAMHLSREIALAAALRCPFATVRPTLLYGVADPHNGYGPNRFRRAANEGEDLVLFGEGEERRDHLLIEDLAEIVLRVLLHRSTGVLNAASGDVHSFRSIAEMVVAAAGSTARIQSTPRTGPMPHNGYRAFDISAARAAFFGFDPMPLPEGLRLVQAGLAGASSGAA